MVGGSGRCARASALGVVLAAAGLIAAFSPTARAGESTRDLPEAFRKSPWNKRTLSVGAPNAGHLVRGKRLAATSSLRLWNTTTPVPSYASPNLLRALDKAANKTRAAFPGTTTVVTALSNEKGGAIRGKRSHQTGRDADVVFFLVDDKGKPATSKQLVHVGGDGRGKDDKGAFRFDDARNWAFVEALATDHDKQVTHVFVDTKVRQRLIAHAQKAGVADAKRDAVMEVLFAEGGGDEPLDAMFHIRVVCPEGQAPICSERAK